MPIQGIIRALRTSAVLLLGALLTPAAGLAGDWTHWRGPYQTGVADDTGLISTWSKEGENLIWRADFTGRSTPVVFDGRVCATGRHGEGIDRLGTAVCWDAETGKKLWEQRWPVYNTAVPWTRVNWASPAADAETGYLYVQTDDGRVIAFDRAGKIVWEWNLGEDLGRFSGYGGRTNTPIVDEDRLLIHNISSVWGPHRAPGDRFIAFDKRTGDILWMTPRNEGPDDLNTYSTPVVAVIGGQRLLIGGGCDGWMRAVNARTGKDVWKFQLSQRGLNVSPVVAGDLVYAAHSEENVDAGTMGRLVAIDGTGTGDVTKTHERWRVDLLQAGYASPAIHDGRLYLPDNSANLFAFDAATGKHLWELNYGTVGKGSPVWADGKIYLTEVNGNFVIVRPGDASAEILDLEYLEMPGGERYAEFYGSPAVAYGRIYFATEEGMYCLGDKSKPFAADAGEPVVLAEPPVAADAKPAHLQVVPAIAVGPANSGYSFEVRSFDAQGRALGKVVGATWSLAGLPGTVSDAGVVTFDAAKVAGTQVGTVTAKVGDLESTAMVRIAGALPWQEDFEGVELGKAPPSWLGTGKGAAAKELDGGKVLAQPKAARGAPRANVYVGPAYLEGYTIQADLKGNSEGRRMTDVGVTNSGYTAELQGAHQRLHVSSWTAERRMAKEISFAWEMGVWYTMKLRVDYEGSGDATKGVVRVKVWRRGEPEPADWTLTAEDPHPIRRGSPGLYTFAPVEAYFDNVLVTVSE